MQPDIPVTDAYHIGNYPGEQIIIRPYPALDPIYAVEFLAGPVRTGNDALHANVRLLKPGLVRSVSW